MEEWIDGGYQRRQLSSRYLVDNSAYDKLVQAVPQG